MERRQKNLPSNFMHHPPTIRLALSQYKPTLLVLQPKPFHSHLIQAHSLPPYHTFPSGIMFIVLLLISSFLGYPLLRCFREFMGILISLFMACRLSCIRNSCFLFPFQSIFKIARLTKEGLTEEAFECNVDAYKKCLSSDDAKIVMKKLGLLSSKERHDDGNCKDCHLLSGVYHLLEEKEASVGELEEAFTVFDENGDGFISPNELQRVMRMLGFKEGMKLEECEKMIRAYDDDGDGRICFREFKAILEYAT